MVIKIDKTLSKLLLFILTILLCASLISACKSADSSSVAEEPSVEVEAESQTPGNDDNPEESDTDVADEPQPSNADQYLIDLAEQFGLPAGYKAEIIYESPGAAASYIAKSQDGTIYVQHTGAFPRLSVLNTGDKIITKIDDLPSNMGISIVAGGPEDTCFILIGAEIRQYSSDGSYQIWGSSELAFPLAYSSEIGLIGVKHSVWNSIGKLLPSSDYIEIAADFGAVFDLVVLGNGDIILLDIRDGKMIRINTDGKRIDLVNEVFEGEAYNIKLDLDENLYFRTHELFHVNKQSGDMELIPLDAHKCSLIPGDFVITDDNKIILVGDQIIWADLDTLETELLIHNQAASFAADIGLDNKLYIGVTGCGEDPPSRVARVEENGELVPFIDGIIGYIRDLDFSAGGGIFIAVEDNYRNNHIYYQASDSNSLTELPEIPSGEFSSIAVDPLSGNILVTFLYDPTVYEIGFNGLTTQHRIDFPRNIASFRLAFSPDGDLYSLTDTPDWRDEGRTDRWIMELDLDTGQSSLVADLSRNEPIGTMNVFNIDPDGMIWVMVNPDQKLYRISPEGEVDLVADQLPIDIPSIDISDTGDIFLTASDGIFRLFQDLPE